jgi:Fe-S-cluster containining protein
MPASQKKSLNIQTDEPDCLACKSVCCRHIASHIDTPTTKKDFDHLRWYLMHEHVKVGIDLDANWLLEVATPCRHLKNNRCAIYTTRPKICRDYPGKNHSCEFEGDTSPYKVLFKNHAELETYLGKKGKKWKWE